MINGVTMKINIDEYLLNALKEDITSEDVTTNAVMPKAKQGKVDLICMFLLNQRIAETALDKNA